MVAYAVDIVMRSHRLPLARIGALLFGLAVNIERALRPLASYVASKTTVVQNGNV